jgi:prevent-host-death family protein
MKTLTASDFKAHCLAVLDEVARTGERVTVLKRGRPMAQIVPSVPGDARFPQQRLIGSVEILGDVVSPVLEADAWEATR